MNKELTIIQYNTNRSKDVVMAQFMRDPTVLKAGIIAIQEPWANPFQETTHHPAKQTHQLLYPQEDETGGLRTRVCFFVSKKLGGWTHRVHSRDCQELRLRHRDRELRIFNIYNQPENGEDTVQLLTRLIPPVREQAKEPGITYLVVGDFNLHHPYWGGEGVEQEEAADEWLDAAETRALDLWLKPGSITRMQAGSQSTLDLVFASASLDGRMIDCRVAEDVHADSDHLPVRTIIDFETEEPAEAPKRRNWKEMDEGKFLTFVNTNLQGKPWLHLRGQPIRPRQIDDAVDHLMEVVQRGVQESTPWARPSRWANPAFTPECREAVKTTRQLRREYVRSQGLGEWAAYTLARNRKGKVIARANRARYRTWVKEITEEGPKGMWKVGKWARNRAEASSGSIIPALKRPDGSLADTNEAKVDVLKGVFFPQPPTPDLDDIQRDKREVEQIPFPPVSAQEVRDAIRRAPPDKAPGDDTVPNRVWRLLAGIPNDNDSAFINIITSIFDACIRTGYNPRHFQSSITVTLRKGGPKDYRMPKSYRPVALLNTLGKLLESVIATRIAWAAEEKGILPKGHLGGRKGVSVDHAIQLILDRVYKAWGIDRKVSMLLLDVSGAYDNVSHERLLYNIKKLGLGHFVPWTQSFLQGRSTRIRLPGFLSDQIPTPTGIPQGSPISPILFLLFNTPLVDGCTLLSLPCGGHTEAFGWVDDVCIVVVSESYARNIDILQQAYKKAAIWARRHSAKFAPDKFELIHLCNPRQPPPPAWTPQPPRDIYEFHVEEGDDQMPLQLPEQTITPSSHARYLGVWLDKYLDFTTHRNKVIAKANSSLEAFRGITGSTWGTSLSAMRQIYRAVVIPQLFWGLTAWWSPASGNMPATERARIIRGFTRIQKRAALMISGAFKSISAAALDIELFLTPINLLMQQTIEETAIRIQTGMPWAVPDGIKAHTKRRPRDTKQGGITPLEALKWKKNGPLAPLRVRGQEVQWESRTAFVLPPWETRIKCVMEDAEAAIQTHDRIELDAALADGAIQRVFTDGSGLTGLVGASAVDPLSADCMQRHLGSLEHSNVYAAELTGIEMGLEQLVNRRQDEDKVRELVIFSDSQAAIKSVQNPKRPSGQYVLGSIYDHVRAIRSRQTPTSITLRWIPAHVGVSGNEAADGAAKSAALWGAGGGSDKVAGDGADQPFIRLASAAKRNTRKRINQRWKKQWEREKTAAPTRRLVKAPTRKVLKLYEGLTKPSASILIQMRSMRIGLGHFLYKIKERESDRCSCDQGSQTPRHVLLQCPLYTDLRRIILDKVARTDLGSTTDYDAIVSHPRAARYAAAMMHLTGLLGQFRHVEAEPESETDIGDADDDDDDDDTGEVTGAVNTADAAGRAFEEEFERMFGLTATG
jgi:Ribonuclease HI